MAQNYTEFPNTQTLNVSYGKMMDNFKTFRSLNAGTVFPSTLLYEGTPCWREDLDELYIYDGTSAWNKINAANADTLGTYAETAFGRLAANAVITGNWQIKNAEPSLETWEDDAPTDAKRWKIRSVAGSLRLSTYSDTGSFLSDAIIFGRNGDITEGGNLLSAKFQAINANIPTVVASQAEAEAGTSTANRVFTPQRVAQAVTSLGFAVGTKMAFFQAFAPTGWTQDVTNNDAMLRVVSGTGGGVGGVGSPISFSTSHTHTTGSVALTIAQMPTHNHTIVSSGVFVDLNNSQGPGNNGAGGFTGGQNVLGVSSGGSSGSGVAHNHGSTNTAGATFTPKYIDMIICTKS